MTAGPVDSVSLSPAGSPQPAVYYPLPLPHGPTEAQNTTPGLERSIFSSARSAVYWPGMGKLILCCIAAVLEIQAQAQTPTVVGVANDPPSSPTISPGSIGYVFGSNFGTVENTVVAVGGRKAQVLAVSSNQIRALFPPNLPSGSAALRVTVDGKASETVDVMVSPRDPGRISVRRGSISAGPASPPSPAHPPETTRLETATPSSQPSFPNQITTAVSGSGIVYTCDATITAASATACNTLNTTIAALYSSAFKNANSSIYITLGATGLGMSDWLTNDASYITYRNLLIASESDPNDITAVNDSVPATNPFGSDSVSLTTSLQRALGFGPPATGLEKDGSTFCTLGTTGCYDGVITVSNSVSLYFRTGTISGGQFDFFTVAEHETDEILGTASCAIYGFCTNDVLPADFFRYHSSGARSTLSAGANASCSSSNSTNACFSLDGVHMLQQYNNINNGDDAGDWVQNCSSPLVQDAVLCSGTAGVDISPASEILVLDVVGFRLANSSVGELEFYPVAPCRLVDTRGAAAGFNGIAPFSGPSIPSKGTITIPVQSVAEASADTTPAPCGVIPSTAQAYSFNLTVVPAAGGAVDYVSLWPAGSTQPFVSTLDDPEGLIVSNAAIVPAGTPTGGISVYNDGPSTTDVIIDMNGYFAPPSTGLQFYPVAPCRLVDTRGEAAGFNGIAPFSGPSIPGKGTITIPVQSATEASADTEPAPCGVIPSAAKAYSFNLTVVPAAGGAVDYVSLWPSGSTQPFVSTLDDPEGLIVSNAAIVPAGTPSGGVSVFNDGPATTDVVIDMNGYFAAPSTGLQFYPVAPCRLVDTRGAAAGFNGIAPFSGPSIPGGGTITIPVQSVTEASTDTTPAPCGVIPSAAQAYSFNLTVVPPAGGRVDYVSLWGAGSTQPVVSTLDDPEALIVSNAAIVPAGSSSGGISVFNAGPSTTDVVIDMNGYFAVPID